MQSPVQAGGEPALAGLCSMAMRPILLELASGLARERGIVVHVEALGGVEVARRIEGGASCDFVALAGEAIATLQDSGALLRDGDVSLAQSPIAIAVAAGTKRPAVATEGELREAILGARTVGYSSGPSGKHLLRLLERWGIEAAVRDRLVQAPPGVGVGSLVARGEVGIGFQQASELMNVEGIVVLGAMPEAIQHVTTFRAAVCARSTRQGDVRKLLAVLASPEADATKRRHGMEPVASGRA